MERLFPTEQDPLPILQLFTARDIKDVLYSRNDVVASALEKFLQSQKELNYLIHKDNIIERWLYFLSGFTLPSMPQILVDRQGNPKFYRVTRNFIFVPRVQHTKGKGQRLKGGGVTIHDSSGQMEVNLPDHIYLRILRNSGEEMDLKSLRQNDWRSDVILVSNYTESGDSYTLIRVLNTWAREPNREELRSMVSLFGHFPLTRL